MGTFWGVPIIRVIVSKQRPRRKIKAQTSSFQPLACCLGVGCSTCADCWKTCTSNHKHETSISHNSSGFSGAVDQSPLSAESYAGPVA